MSETKPGKEDKMFVKFKYEAVVEVNEEHMKVFKEKANKIGGMPMLTKLIKEHLDKLLFSESAYLKEDMDFTSLATIETIEDEGMRRWRSSDGE